MLFTAAITPALVRPTPIFAAPGQFAPEIGVPMTFTRTLERGLSVGDAIIVSRSYLVSIAKVGAGFVITGGQSDIEVAAPPALAALASIEKARVDTQSFPLQLGANGWIMGAKAEVDQASVRKAVAEAIDMIDAAGLPAGEAVQARAFLVGMQKAASDSMAMPPADLFCPPDHQRTERQTIALPNGLEGEIDISFKGQRSPETGVMRNAERKITTRLDSSIRHSAERWSLAPRG